MKEEKLLLRENALRGEMNDRRRAMRQARKSLNGYREQLKPLDRLTIQVKDARNKAWENNDTGGFISATTALNTLKAEKHFIYSCLYDLKQQIRQENSLYQKAFHEYIRLGEE